MDDIMEEGPMKKCIRKLDPAMPYDVKAWGEGKLHGWDK